MLPLCCPKFFQNGALANLYALFPLSSNIDTHITYTPSLTMTSPFIQSPKNQSEHQELPSKLAIRTSHINVTWFLTPPISTLLMSNMSKIASLLSVIAQTPHSPDRVTTPDASPGIH